MLDATLWGEAGAVAARPSSRGPGNLPNKDAPVAVDDVSVLPVGTAVLSLESAVVPKFSSTFLSRLSYKKNKESEGSSSLRSEPAHAR
jgi:hypothetical protein